MRAQKDQLVELQAKYSTTTSEIFQELINDITSNDKEWKKYWDSEKPE